MRWSILALVISLAALSAGCPLTAIKAQQDRNDAIAKYQADSQAAYAAGMANAQSDMYVVADEVWFCPSADDARKRATCPGGKRFARGQKLKVIGQEPVDGVWRSEIWDAKGSHPGFVLAAAVNELPETGALDDFVVAIDRRYPASKRIPVETVNYADLVSRPKAYAGRVLLLRQPSGQMLDKDFGDETFTFIVPIPARHARDHRVALAQFELSNRELVAAFNSGQHSYSCSSAYCDEFVIVARLAGRTVDRVDEVGNVVRLPVFTVIEMADRFGTYQGAR